MNYATMSTGKAAISRASRVLDEVVANEETELSADQSSGSEAAHQGGDRSEHNGAGLHPVNPDNANNSSEHDVLDAGEDIDEPIRKEEEENRRLEQQCDRQAKLRKLQELRTKNAAKRKELQSSGEQRVQRVHAPSNVSAADHDRVSGVTGLTDIRDLRRSSALQQKSTDFLQQHHLVDDLVDDDDDDDDDDASDVGDQRGMLNGRRKKVKSGMDVKVTDRVLYPQLWSHNEVENEFSLSNLKFKELTLRLFVVGELEIITSSNISEIEQSSRLLLLKTLMYYAGNYTWSSILDLYASILQKIELGKAQWGDSFERLEHMILTMRPNSALQAKLAKKKGANNQQNSNGDHVLFCVSYQKGNCNLPQTHMTAWKGDPNNQVSVNHICAKCLLTTGKRAYHPESSPDCPQRK